MDYSIVPRCIYTNLQIASIGQSENDLKSKGVDYTVTKYNLFGNGKAQTLGKKMALSKYLQILNTVKFMVCVW